MTLSEGSRDRVRIGTLGAARITPHALLKPAHSNSEADVVAVAARDPARARAFAGKHRIPRVHNSYEELLADPDVDAVYNPLPNGLHARWTLAAIEAGKHVLCEKPFSANASEAATVAAAAEESGLVVMEAFHYRYHPLAARLQRVVGSGELGPMRHIEAWFCIPLARRDDIRWRLDLAGGATMDLGCYAIHLIRHLAGDEPSVVRARALLRSPGVDRSMTADLAFRGGSTGRIMVSMLSHRIFSLGARVVGDEGEMRVLNPYGPHLFNRVRVRKSRSRRWRRVHVPRGETTYWYQLRAFTDAILRSTPILTPPSDAVANMRVIDAVYRCAGLTPRGISQRSDPSA
ncbi:MAG: Gfo/Idh/MocA family protein [Actinomycetota bacterium]